MEDNITGKYQSIAVLDKATRMLAEIRTIDDAKELIDLAEAARVYAKQIGLGLEAQNHAAEIKLRAQRRAGEILGRMEKAKGRGERGEDGQFHQRLHDETSGENPSTYADLDITKRDAHVWQTIAVMPGNEFESFIDKKRKTEITTAGIYKEAKQLRQKGQQEIQTNTEFVNSNCQVLLGDFREISKQIPDNDIDLIFTDPPYGREYLPLWSDLSLIAQRVLRSGGLLIAYSGQYYLPEVMNRLSEYLEYFWLVSLVMKGPHNQIQQRKINNGYKPLLFYGKNYVPDHWMSDVFFGGGMEKEFHEWQQAENEAVYYIETLTKPGGKVFDPFLGGGTTALAASKLNRSFIGCDIDEFSISQSVRRLSDNAGKQ